MGAAPSQPGAWGGDHTVMRCCAEQEVSEHLDALKPAVSRLAHLETLAQGFYFSRNWRAQPMQE